MTESEVVAVDINTLQIICHWKAAHTAVLMLRTQTLNSGQSMLGVADQHSGISVYDLRATAEGSSPLFSRLYHVDVDEVRHFELVGACIAVFHRHEPNVSFWNVSEQRTILCINVQEQARKLSEEFIVDNEEDADGTISNYCCYCFCLATLFLADCDYFSVVCVCIHVTLLCYGLNAEKYSWFSV